MNFYNYNPSPSASGLRQGPDEKKGSEYNYFDPYKDARKARLENILKYEQQTPNGHPNSGSEFERKREYFEALQAQQREKQIIRQRSEQRNTSDYGPQYPFMSNQQEDRSKVFKYREDLKRQIEENKIRREKERSAKRPPKTSLEKPPLQHLEKSPLQHLEKPPFHNLEKSPLQHLEKPPLQKKPDNVQDKKPAYLNSPQYKQYLIELDKVKEERIRAKEAMLEMREMMLNEKQKQLEIMIERMKCQNDHKPPYSNLPASFQKEKSLKSSSKWIYQNPEIQRKKWALPNEDILQEFSPPYDDGQSKASLKSRESVFSGKFSQIAKNGLISNHSQLLENSVSEVSNSSLNVALEDFIKNEQELLRPISALKPSKRYD